MITWFDALLVTLWAAVTALGVRRGLSGLGWGVGGVALCYLANSLGLSPLLSALLAAGLGLALVAGLRRLIRSPVETPWHLAAGALGGFVLGALLVGTLALGFPLDMRVTPSGRAATYPSASLPPKIYGAVSQSVIKNRLLGVWKGRPELRTLLIPDQARR
ncbi:hypothetical protein [Deinococcus hohokamensis]|uniref:Colicin V production protein n=1 Tax=Deinococcus hohokamensis TaxID=309883 RepID=A0ABV9ICB2_9DEIO